MGVLGKHISVPGILISIFPMGRMVLRQQGVCK